MFLNLSNNELIFSKIRDLPEFKMYLKDLKGIKHREYKGKFYFSLGDIDKIRRVLASKYEGRLSFSIPYQRFANRFILAKGNVSIEWGPVTCEIKGSQIPWKDVIEQTSYFNKTALRARTYGKSWSGITHLFDPINGTFPSGLLERILGVLQKNGVPYSIQKTFEYPEPIFSLHPTFEFVPTQDQHDAVAALDKANNGIAKLPTGFGKTSFVAAALIAKKGVPSLFLANKRVLIDDAKADFESVFREDDIKIGMIGDGEFNPGDITVASIQSIASLLTPPAPKEQQIAQYQLDVMNGRLELATDPEEINHLKKVTALSKRKVDKLMMREKRHKQLMEFLKNVQLFIVDESQVLGTVTWDLFLHACPAPYRYTLSATDTRTDGGRIQIIAATGERRFESSAAEQIEKGRLSEFLGHFKKFDHMIDKSIIKELDINYHQAYDLFIVQNTKRNEHLCRQVIYWAANHSVLAIVTRKEHGDIVKRTLVDQGMNEQDCRYIDGDTPKKIRQETIEEFRNGAFPVLIGTSIFDVGFNAKIAAKLVRFNAGGSEVLETQRAGRTVRIRADNSIGETYDMLDVNVPFFEAQGWKRYKLLKEEFGSERVKLHREVVQGELNIVGLKEIVAALPTETDKAKGEEIIKALQFDEDEVEIEGDYNLDDPNLKDILDELTINNIGK